MERRDFLKTSLAASAALGFAPALKGWIPSHNWEKYDFGSGPEVKDRLYQGPFPQYAPENFYGGMVIQYTTPGKQLINCFGMGLTTYISGDLGAPHVAGESLETTIDKLLADTYLCDLVAINNVSITTESNIMYATDGINSIQLYDKFKVLEQGASTEGKFNIIGILSIFKTSYQIYPLLVDTLEGISEITATFDSNAPAYNLSGQKVDANYKGVVIQNGVKFIRR